MSKQYYVESKTSADGNASGNGQVQAGEVLDLLEGDRATRPSGTAL